MDNLTNKITVVGKEIPLKYDTNEVGTLAHYFTIDGKLRNLKVVVSSIDERLQKRISDLDFFVNTVVVDPSLISVNVTVHIDKLIDENIRDLIPTDYKKIQYSNYIDVSGFEKIRNDYAEYYEVFLKGNIFDTDSVSSMVIRFYND